MQYNQLIGILRKYNVQDSNFYETVWVNETKAAVVDPRGLQHINFLSRRQSVRP